MLSADWLLAANGVAERAGLSGAQRMGGGGRGLAEQRGHGAPDDPEEDARAREGTAAADAVRGFPGRGGAWRGGRGLGNGRDCGGLANGGSWGKGGGGACARGRGCGEEANGESWGEGGGGAWKGGGGAVGKEPMGDGKG